MKILILCLSLVYSLSAMSQDRDSLQNELIIVLDSALYHCDKSYKSLSLNYKSLDSLMIVQTNVFNKSLLNSDLALQKIRAEHLKARRLSLKSGRRKSLVFGIIGGFVGFLTYAIVQ